jgi:hypothetical protein
MGWHYNSLNSWMFLVYLLAPLARESWDGGQKSPNLTPTLAFLHQGGGEFSRRARKSPVASAQQMNTDYLQKSIFLLSWRVATWHTAFNPSLWGERRVPGSAVLLGPGIKN